ncbi:MAG: RNA polymerase sigma factor [Candidatus Saccharimonadales bacterium]|jgi:RNA polymerase sigma-70 factor (ECF subfamily)
MAKKSLSNNAMDEAPEDFERLYKSTQPAIYRFIFWRTKDEMLAQDLTSNVYLKAWRTRKSFTGGSSTAWLYRIARTTLIDHWRRKKDISDNGSLAETVASDTPDIGEEIDLSLSVEALQQALLLLPVEMYEVVKLRFIQGKSTRETAQALDLSESNVRVIQYRALKKLKGYLQ